jgi:ABC-type spermidine/putrescine transport system permease subunit II
MFMDTAIDIVLKLVAITVAFTVVLLIVAYTVLAEPTRARLIQGRLRSASRRLRRRAPTFRGPAQVHP